MNPALRKYMKVYYVVLRVENEIAGVEVEGRFRFGAVQRLRPKREGASIGGLASSSSTTTCNMLLYQTSPRELCLFRYRSETIKKAYGNVYMEGQTHKSGDYQFTTT